MREIKLIQGNICKKFLMPFDYENLINLACSSFIMTRDMFTFNYTDEEGDKINIANQFDYEQVIKLYENNKNKGGNGENSSSAENKSVLKINIERISPKNSETINTPNSPITQSLLMLTSHVEEEENLHNNLEEVNDLKLAIRGLVRSEIDEKVDEMKSKLLSSIENRLSTVFSQFVNGNSNNILNLPTIKRKRSAKSVNNNLLGVKKKEKKKPSSHGILNLNLGSNSNSKLVVQKEKKFCRKCGHSILPDDYYYNCFHCEDVCFCLSCEKEEDVNMTLNPLSQFQSSNSKHLLLKVKNPDSEHLDSLNNIKRFKTLQQNKKKIITEREKYTVPIIHTNDDYYHEGAFAGVNILSTIGMSNPIIAFNNLTEKIVIEIENTSEDEVNINNNDFYTISINFVNVSKKEIKRNSYLECLFDQSDIFGNKIFFEEIIQGYEEFNLKMMFYNFKNKPSGYYSSKWRLVQDENINNTNKNSIQSNKLNKNCSFITFVFYLRQRGVMENDIYNLDLLTGHKEKTSGTIGTNKEKEKEKVKEEYKFPDLFSEIIKKHQKKEK